MRVLSVANSLTVYIENVNADNVRRTQQTQSKQTGHPLLFVETYSTSAIMNFISEEIKRTPELKVICLDSFLESIVQFSWKGLVAK
jgi:hypothetical protein